MKLTEGILIEAPNFISPLGTRSLSLRNLHLSSLDAIKTLESTDIFSTIDLSKNDLVYLTDFPSLLKVDTLLLSNNHIRYISGLSKLVNLECLSLTFNDILYISDLENLKELPSLRALYLTGNPIVKNSDYRLWCIWRFPNLQVLDFERVKDSERQQAKELFTDDPHKVDTILSLGSNQSIHKNNNITLSSHETSTLSKKSLSDEDREELAKQLEDADSLEEIQRIEDILTRGYL